MENNYIINIRNLNVHNHHSQILKNINLDIPRNKITVVLGPSGCGKTTLLKCLNRLTDLYNDLTIDGDIFFDDDNILKAKKNHNHIRQKMGLLSQRPYPLPMSIYNNISYGLKIRSIKNKHVIKDKVQKHLEEVGLWNEVKDRLHTKADHLSIGQQQRLCLARGLAVNPEIILADEPTSALDPVSSKIIESQFLALKNKYTLVVVTHILRQAKRLADNVVFMYYGEIVEQGDPHELFENPQSDQLKEFLSVGY